MIFLYTLCTHVTVACRIKQDNKQVELMNVYACGYLSQEKSDETMQQQP